MEPTNEKALLRRHQQILAAKRGRRLLPQVVAIRLVEKLRKPKQFHVVSEDMV